MIFLVLGKWSFPSNFEKEKEKGKKTTEENRVGGLGREEAEDDKTKPRNKSPNIA